MTATDITAAIPATPEERSASWRLIFSVICVVVPVAIWFAPLAVPHAAKGAMAVTSFMILAWMTNVMEYGAAGVIGCVLFWALGVAKFETAFSGFVSDTPWFLVGAILLGEAANKTGIPQRIGAFVVTRVGTSYSRLLLGLIITTFLLTFVVPSGSARIVIMAAIAIGVINVFGVGKGSNIGRAIFLCITYTAAIFDKMIIAGAGAITARGIIVKVGGVNVSWGLWFIAYLPCALLTIWASWRFALWVFPPEVENLDGRMDQLKDKLRASVPWNSMALKSSILSGLAIILWLTDFIHHVSPTMIALLLAMAAFLPGIDILNAKDMERTNLLPFFFVAAALGMSSGPAGDRCAEAAHGFLFRRLAALACDQNTCGACALLGWVRLSFCARQRDIDARNLTAAPDGIRQIASPRSTLDRDDLGILRRRKAFRVSVRATGNRLFLWLFPAYGFDQDRRGVNGDRVRRSRHQRCNLLAPSGAVTRSALCDG